MIQNLIYNMIKSNPIFCRAGGIQDFPIWVQLIPQVEHIIQLKGTVNVLFFFIEELEFILSLPLCKKISRINLRTFYI